MHMKVKNRAIKARYAPKKGTKLQKNLGVSNEEMKRAVAVRHVIDTNKRTRTNREPKFTK